MGRPEEVNKAAHLGVLPYESEEDLCEAAENFRAYLAILKEWDERERQRLDAKTPRWLVDLNPGEKI